MLTITAWVAALAAVALVGLSLPVSLRRMKVGTDVGVGEDPVLLRRIRAQGNFIEYVPIGLMLLALCEYRAGASISTWSIALLLCAGRAAHATGMLSGSSVLRAAGMLATYGALLTGAVAVLL